MDGDWEKMGIVRRMWEGKEEKEEQKARKGIRLRVEEREQNERGHRTWFLTSSFAR